MSKALTLWSLRVSAARGNHFVAETQVTEETAQDWLKVFRRDEPSILFLVAAKKPSIRRYVKGSYARAAA